MPTPVENGAASITQRTGGFFRPCSMDASRTLVSRSGCAAGRGEAEIVHQPPRDGEHRQQDGDAKQERHSERGRLGDHASRNGAAEHRRTADRLTLPNTSSRLPV